MTIHSSHPFADPAPDPVRRLRGRLTGSVALVTAGDAGLTVSSLLVANGEPARVLALVDPDSDLAAAVEGTGRAVVQLLSWSHRDLADAFAGTAPSPGGPFRTGSFTDTPAGPRLVGATTWVATTLESAATVGWSTLLTLVVDEVVVGDDDEPLVHRRGRWVRP